MSWPRGQLAGQLLAGARGVVCRSEDVNTFAGPAVNKRRRVEERRIVKLCRLSFIQQQVCGIKRTTGAKCLTK